MIRNKWNKDYIWTFTTYFTEGFPFVIIRTISSVFFRDMKVSLESIGLTPLFGLPWILKFLWGPQVDEYSTKKRWLLGMQFMLLMMMFLAAVFAPLETNVQLIAGLFFIGSLIAATHDVAIDGYYMEALDKNGQAKYVGHRVMAYRISMMTGTGIIVTIGTNVNWSLAFATAAIVFGLFFLYHLFFLREVEDQNRPISMLFFQGLKIKTLVIFFTIIALVLGIRLFFQSDFYSGLAQRIPLLREIRFSHWAAILLLASLTVIGLFRKRIKSLILRDSSSYYSRAFVTFMEREHIGIILAFIILMRAGEWALTTMVSPFIVDLGIKVHYGWISGLVGLPSAIIGALLGGWFISRRGLKRMMWPFLLAQNLTNLIYMFLAHHLSRYVALNTGMDNPVGIGTLNMALVGGVHGFDQFASGLGNAVLMTFLMRICHKEFKAAHYAIGSGLMNVSSIFAGVMSGFVASWLGYGWLFGLSFVISVPAMILIPYLPYLSDPNESKANH